MMAEILLKCTYVMDSMALKLQVEVKIRPVR